MTKALSDRFWSVPEDAFQHEDTTKLHEEITVFLRNEFSSRPGLGTVEMMMVERTAFFYCWVRDRERSGVGTEDGSTPNPVAADADQDQQPQRQGFVHERNYKEAIQLLSDMLARLQRASSDTADPARIKDETIEQHTAVMLSGIDTLDLPEETKKHVRDHLVMTFQGADI
jgi:hypothetical protein